MKNENYRHLTCFLFVSRLVIYLQKTMLHDMSLCHVMAVRCDDNGK